MIPAGATYRIVDPKHYDGPLTLPKSLRDGIGCRRRAIYVVTTADGHEITWTSFRSLAIRLCRQ